MAQDDDAVEHINDVVLVGRLGADPQVRVLPSGDELVTFRVVVPRPPRPPRAADTDGRRVPTVDTIDCAVEASGIRRRVQGWGSGDVVEVRGALHRRFWRGANGLGSRYEVHVARARRVRRA